MKSVLQERKLALKIEQFLLTTIHNNEKLVSAPEDLSKKERSKYVYHIKYNILTTIKQIEEKYTQQVQDTDML